jgi:biopolymer transport protein ExbD
MQAGPSGGGIDEDEDEGGGIFAEINITPLTDVFMVLLIILMVVSSAVVEEEKQDAYEKGLLAERALQVMTPDGAAAADEIVIEDVVLSVLPDGTVYIENDEVPRDLLEGKLSEIYGKDPKTRIVLRADKTADYALVMDVIAKCSNVGLNNIALASKDG